MQGEGKSLARYVEKRRSEQKKKGVSKQEEG